MADQFSGLDRGWTMNEVKVRIWPSDKYDAESSLFTPAMEFRVSLKVACSKVKNGKLPVTCSGLVLSRKGIALTAFGPNPDGDGTVLRLWEQAGKSGTVVVTLPTGSKFNKAQPIILRRETIGNLVEIVNGKFEFLLGAYALGSFILSY